MKTKTLALLTIICVGISSCYDDAELRTQIADHEQRIQTLETLCNQMNTNISALQTIVTALQQNDYVTNVSSVTEGGKEIGYTITFSKSGAITIYHGNDGYTPTVGVKQDADGVYCWTLNGEWLLDDAGNKIKAAGTDGVTPQLKIEEDYWYVSYDNGKTWQQLYKAVGEDGDSFFKSVTQDEGAVTLTLADGNVISIPRHSNFTITFDADGNKSYVMAGEEITISYTIENATESMVVSASSDGNYKVKVTETSNSAGKLDITAPNPYTDGYINVLVSDGNGYSDLTIINFNEKAMSFSNGYDYNVSEEGGVLEIPLKTNFDYIATVEYASQSWISVTETKAAEMRDGMITLNISKNEAFASRKGVVKVCAANNPDYTYCEITVNQASAYFTSAQTVFVIEPEGGESKTSVSSSLGLHVNSDDLPSWLTVGISENADAANAYLVTMTAAANDEDKKRSAKVKLYADDTTTELGTLEVVQLDDASQNKTDLVFTVRANFSNDFTACLPLAGQVDCYVDWGDGTVQHYEFLRTSYYGVGDNDNNVVKHRYENLDEAKSFEVRVSGTVTALTQHKNDEFRTSITDVIQWGNTGLTSMDKAFEGCRSLKSIPSDETYSFVDVTTFWCTFHNCISLESVPAGIFANGEKIQFFGSIFQSCEKLSSLPEGLFANCVSATEYGYAFKNCISLTELPQNIFKDNTKVTSFEQAFYGCTGIAALPENLFLNCSSVTTFDSVFRECTSLVTIPENIFFGCSEVTSFASAFYNCDNIVELPEKLFYDCKKVETFDNAFRHCDKLTTIPAGLFAQCPEVSDFSNTFYWCSSLNDVPINIFDNNRKVKNFSYCFYYCHATCESPYTIIDGIKYHLYERSNASDYFVTPTSYYACFLLYSGNRWTDYDSIPSTWK